MPKTISNGTLREMTSDEEIEYNKSIEADNLLEAERAKVKYKDDRKMAYPEIGDQLDALYHAGVFPKEMADKIKAVKAKYPKPE